MTTIVKPINTFDLFFRDFFNTTGQFTTPDKTKASYPVDIYQDSTGMHFDIPCIGIEKEEIKITTNSDILKIAYEKDLTQEQSNREYLCKGIANRSFNLGYKFSSKFDLSKVEAIFNNGLLKLHIPFSKEGSLKEVKIK
jgi:HSP20 family protein